MAEMEWSGVAPVTGWAGGSFVTVGRFTFSTSLTVKSYPFGLNPCASRRPNKF